MASHQTFSNQIKHMSGQIKFGQTNFLYIINGKFIKFGKEINIQTSFSPYHKHWSMHAIVILWPLISIVHGAMHAYHQHT